MEVIIGPATQNNIDGLLELWKEFMKDPTSGDRPIPTHAENIRRWKEFISKLIDEDPRQIQVAAQGNLLVGYIVCLKTDTTPLDMGYKWSYISDIYVRPTHRRQGIGRKLMQAIVEYVRSVGSSHVRLTVWCRNSGAMKLYEQLGFREHMYTLQIDLRRASQIELSFSP